MNSIEFIKKVNEGAIDIVKHTESVLESCKNIDKNYDCFITIAEKLALEQAKEIKKRLSKKEKLPLAGLPVSIKDCISTKGIRTTAGSKILENYIPPYDAEVILKLKKAGAIIIGKTAQDEFGFGTFSTNCAFKIPKNPLDRDHSAGGSSGGAGVITKKADFPHIAIAESTGGSISAPSSFCGVFGLTPSYGLVSRYGLISYADSLDKIGVMAKSTKEIELMLNQISGFDKKDATSLQIKKKFKIKKEFKGMKIGIPKECLKNIDKSVENSFYSAVEKLKKQDIKVEETSFPLSKYVVSAYYVIAVSEASTNLAHLCGMRYGLSDKLEGGFNEFFSKVRTQGFGEEAKRRIILGTYARMAGYREQYYLKAMKVRTLIINDYLKLFKKYSALISPTMPVLSPRFEEIEKLTPLQNYQMDILTVGPNLAGIPMLNVPLETKTLPAGLHILGNYLDEDKLLSLGSVFGWAKEK